MNLDWLADPQVHSFRDSPIPYLIWIAVKYLCIGYPHVETSTSVDKTDSKAPGEQQDMVTVLNARARTVIRWSLITMPMNGAVAWYAGLAWHPYIKPYDEDADFLDLYIRHLPRILVILLIDQAAIVAFLFSPAKSQEAARFCWWQARVFMLDCIIFPPLIVLCIAWLAPQAYYGGPYWVGSAAMMYAGQAVAWMYFF